MFGFIVGVVVGGAAFAWLKGRKTQDAPVINSHVDAVRVKSIWKKFCFEFLELDRLDDMMRMNFEYDLSANLMKRDIAEFEKAFEKCRNQLKELRKELE